jgi:hypothetical protein
MNKKGSIVSIFVIIPILIIVLYIGDLRCQENHNNLNAGFQSQYAEISETKNDNINNDKNTGVEILEWMIKRNLNYKYSKLEPEELEDMLEKRK